MLVFPGHQNIRHQDVLRFGPSTVLGFINFVRLDYTQRKLNPASCPPPASTHRLSFRTRHSMALQADLDHIALDCKSPPLELVNFYVNVFGFAPYRVEQFKQGTVPFPSVRVSPVTILDFFAAKQPEALSKGLSQGNHFCFALSKVQFDELLVRLEDNDVDIIDGPAKRSGARGDGTSIYVKDPDANVIEFRYYSNANQDDTSN